MFPRLFHIGSFNAPTYGLLVATGVLVGLWVSVRNSKRLGIDADDAWNLGIVAVLAGIVGAKILYIINDWSIYSAHPSQIFTWNTMQAAGVFSGGLLAALAAIFWYIRRRNMPAMSTCDAFAPGLAIGHAIGRIGCFAAGCCWGKPTGHFWGITFTNPLAEELVGTPLHQALQPTQLFESAVELANFFVLMWMLKHRKFEGEVFAAYMILYGVARFFLEFLRGDPGRGEIIPGVLSGTQLISIGLVIAGGIVWWLRSGARMPVPARAAR